MASGFDLTNAQASWVTETLVPPDNSDAALVKAAQEGHREAFGQLYQRYARMVHGILLARTPALEAEDLVHEVFLRALSRLQGLREVSCFGAWLAAISRNMAKDYHRQPRVQIERNDDSAAAYANAATDEHADTRNAAEILESVRSLPEAYRETLILRLVEGMTGPEIAAKTGLSHGSVRVNLNRGMQQLREKLGRRRVSANAAKKISIGK
jgi:RNA polymerase sigma-70 factor (ECF subfamily)